MITIMIYKDDKLTNVVTKTLWEFAEWYKLKASCYDVDKWYDKSSGSFEMYMKNGIKYIIEENK